MMSPPPVPRGRSTRTPSPLIALLAAVLATGAAGAAEDELTGSAALQGRLYPDAPADPVQDRHDGSAAIELEYTREWEAGDRITVKPFFRYDFADAERTHFDLREAYWLTFGADWELRLGVDKVFWGVTESVHLVDIVNQTDLVENPDGEDKLGQPMAALSWTADWGTVDFLLLPYFRTRTFPGRDGRLRLDPPVDDDRPLFESGLGRFHPDFAVRYSHAIGPLDLGLAYFRGTGREPSFFPGLDDSGRPILRPFYPLIDQGSIDAQVTLGPWLLKIEGLYRRGQPDLLGAVDGYFASATGFEYTFFDIFESGIDVGVLAEYLFDDRGRRALTPFENDVFVGLRLAFNDVDDSAILAGLIQDIGSSARNYFIEASRRLGDSWTVGMEARFFTEAPPDDFLFAVRRDDFIQLDLTFHF